MVTKPYMKNKIKQIAALSMNKYQLSLLLLNALWTKASAVHKNQRQCGKNDLYSCSPTTGNTEAEDLIER